MDQQCDECKAEAIREEQSYLNEKLLANLERELSLQQSLVDLLEEERVVLTMASTSAIDEINTRKEDLLIKEKKNAAARRDITAQLCSLLGCEGAKITLSGLVDMAFDKNQADRLQSHKQSLTNVATTVRINNQRNRELIHAALADVQGSLRLIQSLVCPGGNYEKTGQFNMNSMQGSLLHREG